MLRKGISLFKLTKEGSSVTIFVPNPDYEPGTSRAADWIEQKFPPAEQETETRSQLYAWNVDSETNRSLIAVTVPDDHNLVGYPLIASVETLNPDGKLSQRQNLALRITKHHTSHDIRDSILSDVTFVEEEARSARAVTSDETQTAYVKPVKSSPDLFTGKDSQ